MHSSTSTTTTTTKSTISTSERINYTLIPIVYKPRYPKEQNENSERTTLKIKP